MNWYIGMEVVCINAKQLEDTLKEGKIYTIKGISACKCGINIDVGLSDGTGTYCYTCKTDISNDVLWFMASRFAPLEYNKQAIEELLENTLVKSV